MTPEEMRDHVNRIRQERRTRKEKPRRERSSVKSDNKVMRARELLEKNPELIKLLGEIDGDES